MRTCLSRNRPTGLNLKELPLLRELAAMQKKDPETAAILIELAAAMYSSIRAGIITGADLESTIKVIAHIHPEKGTNQ